MTQSHLRQLKHQIEDGLYELLEQTEIPDSLDRAKIEEFVEAFASMSILLKMSDIREY